MLSQGTQDLLNVIQMFVPGFSKYEDVIHIYDYKRVCKWPQYIIHHLHECYWGISQVERHDQPLEGTLFRLEGCLPYIGFLNRHLVVA
jgi:hypothetical protein